MKRLFTLLLVFFSVYLLAQVPEAISYQTIVRNDNGEPIIFQPMDFRISILEGSETGTAVYVEQHLASTNGNGMVSFKLGMGTVLDGNFSEISWGNSPHFIQVELKEDGGTNYILLGVEQFAAVPYAMFAKNTDASMLSWQQNGSNLYFLDGNVGIKTNNPTEALTIGDNERIQLSTTNKILSTGSVMNLRWNAEDAKPGIHFQDVNGNSKIAMSAYNYETYPSVQAKKFSIASTNAAGELIERFNIPYGENEVDISVTNANLMLVNGSAFQVGSESNFGLANYYGDFFIHGTRKMGIGDKDWEAEGTYDNAQLEIYRANNNVELLIHDDAGISDVGLHFRNGENDWEMIHNGDFDINYEGSNYFKITSEGDVGIDVAEPIAKLDVNGNINVTGGYGYLVGGSGKGAYLPVSTPLAIGDIAGMDPNSGNIEKYKEGDIFIGVVCKQAGFVENYSKGREQDANFALIVSKGQLEANLSQLNIKGRLVQTSDGQQIGVLLNNGRIFIK